MINTKKLKKLIGLNKEDFDSFVKDGQIILRPARLIPTLKTGDEGALTSIILSSIKLVKEFRDQVFKDLKLSRNGKVYYYTEVGFPELDEKSRIDGLVIIIKSGVIKEAAFFEMKNKNNIQPALNHFLTIETNVVFPKVYL